MANDPITQMMTALKKMEARYLRFELPDLHGVSRTKVVPIDKVEAYARKGLNFYGGTVALDSASGVIGGTALAEEVSYRDQQLIPEGDCGHLAGTHTFLEVGVGQFQALWLLADAEPVPGKGQQQQKPDDITPRWQRRLPGILGRPGTVWQGGFFHLPDASSKGESLYPLPLLIFHDSRFKLTLPDRHHLHLL